MNAALSLSIELIYIVVRQKINEIELKHESIKTFVINF